MKYIDTVVVGGGIAGLTATSYLSRTKKSVILFEKEYYFGGLVNTFKRGDFKFDGGLRSIENSGIVKPMLRDLGIDIDLVKSHVSLILENDVLKLNGSSSIKEYSEFLIKHFPENKEEIKNIIIEINKITGYMDVLYGIDNPIFLNFKRDKDYFVNEIFPWMFKFIKTIGKIQKLNEPVNLFLKRYTSNMELIDNISQHFFKDTPTSFALSYFSLYNDYNYPLGGTESLPHALEDFSRNNGAELLSRRYIVNVNPQRKIVVDNTGEEICYKNLIWACDLKQLYNLIDIESIKSKKIVNKIIKRKNELNTYIGAESVFTCYLSVDLPPAYFGDIATEHCFYTPLKDGMSKVNECKIHKDKEEIKRYLIDYVKYNTFEISIPSLRDKSLSPIDKTGVEISILFDYKLTENIINSGWKNEFKKFMEELIIDSVNKLYPEMKSNIIKQFSSTPMTMKRYTNNSEGAIVGWSFTNNKIPVVHKFLEVASSVNTPFKNIYKCGQWSYSPAGLPISILTGKLAADKVLK